jgi:hypothetical protein
MIAVRLKKDRSSTPADATVPSWLSQCRFRESQSSSPAQSIKKSAFRANFVIPGLSTKQNLIFY